MSKEPLFPVDPDPIPLSYIRPPSLRDEAIYLLRLGMVMLGVGVALSQLLNAAIGGLY